MSRILFILFFWLAGGTAFAQQVQVAGSLPRDLQAGRFRLTITITNLTQALLDRGAGDGSGNEQLKNRFDIKLVSIGQEILGIDPAEANSDTRVSKFYMEEAQPFELDPKDVTNAADQHSLRYFIDIVEARPGELASKVTTQSLTVSVWFYLGRAQNTTEVAKQENVVIKQEVYLINAQPTFEGDAPIAGSHESLIVNWTVQTAVPTLGENAGLKEPSSVVVYVVHPDVESQTFPAKVFSGAAATPDSAGSCTYTRPAGTEVGACVVCPERTYLDRTALKELLGDRIKIVSAKNSDGSTKVGGLDNDVPAPYTVFMQYLPDGLGASQCLPGQPSPNFTLTELNGEGDAEVVDFRCFVATAAYGSPLAADLKYFRKFRNQVLLKSAPGRWFVRSYYKYSPPVADFVAEHPALRDFVRGILEVPADFLESVDEYY